MTTIRIVLAEDETVVREALGLLLKREDDFAVLAEVDHSDALFRSIVLHEPDVVVCSVADPLSKSLSVIRRMHEAAPDIAILAFSSRDDPTVFFESLDAGANGFVLKRSSSLALNQAIRSLAQGGSYIDPAVSHHLMNRRSDETRRTQSSLTGIARLTVREREVLRGLAMGLSAQQVADELVIAPGTVHTHRLNILKKLGVQSTAALVRAAIRAGLVEA